MSGFGLADTLINDLVGQSASAALSPAAFAALALPSTLTDSSASLSGSQLVDLLSTARTSLLGLASTAQQLDLTSPLSAFFSAAASSSNPGAIAVQSIPGSSASTAPPQSTYTFTVSQLAVAQANVGTALASGGTGTFAAGTDTIGVTQNGVTTDVSFAVGASDTNATVLANLAAAINDTPGLGVTAAVETDPIAGTSQLVVTAASTGTASAFSLSDVAGTAVASAGVANATTAAADAAFTENGTALTSSSNDLFLGDLGQLHVTFLAPTTSPVTATIGPDTSQITAAIASFVDAFNGAQSFFAAHADAFPGVGAELSSLVVRLGPELANVGISAASDGTLSIDSATLGTAVSQQLGSVETALADVSGLASEANALATTRLGNTLAGDAPLPPFQPGFAPQRLAAQFGSQLASVRFTGLLVDALL
ncbi:MAG TPA: flagellar filament capping protein FliD [Candidatus Binatia bacterium]|nr:flagellar filament capping protein FliD [Candidatus Binatia bacterium]